MEEEEYNDIDIQDQKYPQNAETSNVWFTSITTVKKIMKRRVQIKFCVLFNQSDWGKNIYCYRWIKFLAYLNLHDSIDFIMGLNTAQSVI
jgi:hypothetical protein